VSLAQSPKPLFFPHPSFAITVLGPIIIGRGQLTPGGSLGKPAQLDNARPDQNVTRNGERSASHDFAVAAGWSWR
jgi:hypothetical protein